MRRTPLDFGQGACYIDGMKTSNPNFSADGPTHWVDSKGVHNLNFAWAERHYAGMTTESLMWHAKDCREAIAAYPDSPKSGLYADTIHVIAGIIKRRKEAANG